MGLIVFQNSLCRNSTSDYEGVTGLIILPPQTTRRLDRITGSGYIQTLYNRQYETVTHEEKLRNKLNPAVAHTFPVGSFQVVVRGR